MKQQSHTTQSVVAVLRRGDRLLLIKRAPGVILPGYWTPPSGRIEPGETYEQALIREVEDARWVTCEEFLELEPTFSGDRDFIMYVLPTLAPTRSEPEEQEP
jgi:8-oxo-dGTP diphosphatase